MVEITLEVHEIRAGEVKEEIRGLRRQFPEGVTGAPERVLLVDPFPFFLVLLRGNYS